MDTIASKIQNIPTVLMPEPVTPYDRLQTEDNGIPQESIHNTITNAITGIALKQYICEKKQ